MEWCMDFVRRILEFFKNNSAHSANDFNSFLSELKAESDGYVVTVHTEQDGFLTLSMMEKSQWQMIVDICELTSRSVQDMVRQLSDNNEITSIVIDPRDLN